MNILSYTVCRYVFKLTSGRRLTDTFSFLQRSMDGSISCELLHFTTSYIRYHYRVNAIEITIIDMEYSLHFFVFDVNEVQVY